MRTDESEFITMAAAGPQAFRLHAVSAKVPTASAIGFKSLIFLARFRHPAAEST
jgi:hypothetical protein